MTVRQAAAVVGGGRVRRRTPPDGAARKDGSLHHRLEGTPLKRGLGNAGKAGRKSRPNEAGVGIFMAGKK